MGKKNKKDRKLKQVSPLQSASAQQHQQQQWQKQPQKQQSKASHHKKQKIDRHSLKDVSCRSSSDNENKKILFPLPFPPHLPRPQDSFLKDVPPYQEAFQAALRTSYEGFVVDDSLSYYTDDDDDDDNLNNNNTDKHAREEEIHAALERLEQKNFFRTDVTQPFGLGTKCAKTYVTRFLLGDRGNTYKYLGLRMFALDWAAPLPSCSSSSSYCVDDHQRIGKLASCLTNRTRYHLDQLSKTRRQRGAPPTQGRPDYDICLINRMEVSSSRESSSSFDDDCFKLEPTLGKARTAVSWHADSSLEHYSTIAVYQILSPKSSVTKANNKPRSDDINREWSVALRVSKNAEGPQSSRHRFGTEKEEESSKEIDSSSDAPPIEVSLPSGSTYYLLDDFNHHHQHTVLHHNHRYDDNSKCLPQSPVVRYSCTFRLLRTSHNVAYVINRCKNICSNFHRKGAKIWRSEQLILADVESEWLRQFYIQGQQHYDKLWPHWREPIQELLWYWNQLETRTYRTVELLRAAAEQQCYEGDGTTQENSPKRSTVISITRVERKEREKRKKACAAIQDLLGRGSNSSRVTIKAFDVLYKPLAELLEERAQMRENWYKREKDPVFKDMGPECRPLRVPFRFQQPVAQQQQKGTSFGMSPLPGMPDQLRNIASNLRFWGKAYESKDVSDLPPPNKQLDYKPSLNAAPDNNKDDVSTIVESRDGRDIETSHDTNNDMRRLKSLEWPGWSQGELTFGLELQSPWAAALVDGRKTIETRAYPLPSALLGRKIWILESPQGKAGVSALGNVVDLMTSNSHKSSRTAASGDATVRVIGWCRFISVKEYSSQTEFVADESSHLVASGTKGYGWKKQSTEMKAIYGWIVEDCSRCTIGSTCPYQIATRRMRSLFQLSLQRQTEPLETHSQPPQSTCQKARDEGSRVKTRGPKKPKTSRRMKRKRY